MLYTPENILKLEPNQIFVFGSNLAGIHGAGAAYHAMINFGAKYGVGCGRTGQCYAIPTKDFINSNRTLTINEITPFVIDFIQYAKENPSYTFLVTKIGCGLAGYSVKQIAPLFKECVTMTNIILPEEFYNYYN